MILVEPRWQVQLWRPLLLSLAIDHPVLLPSNRQLLTDPANPQRLHPMFPRLHVLVFRTVSRDCIKQRDVVTEMHLATSRPSTRKTYKSARRRWCDRWKVDPFSAPLAFTLQSISTVEQLIAQWMLHAQLSRPLIPNWTAFLWIKTL